MIDVIVVEDDANLRRLALFALRLDPELAPRVCATGAEALAAIATKAPALVLLDLGLPDLDGHEVAARIAELAPAVGIVLFTGEESPRLDGALGVIRKPFDPRKLAAEVRRFTAPGEAR